MCDSCLRDITWPRTGLFLHFSRPAKQPWTPRNAPCWMNASASFRSCSVADAIPAYGSKPDSVCFRDFVCLKSDMKVVTVVLNVYYHLLYCGRFPFCMVLFDGQIIAAHLILGFKREVVSLRSFNVWDLNEKQRQNRREWLRELTGRSVHVWHGGVNTLHATRTVEGGID